jgi:hypothetical protein
VQIFDAAVQDNRNVILRGCEAGKWTTACVDLTADACRNDGTRDTFRAGNNVDDLFIFVPSQGGREPTLFVDEVVLFDAGTRPE